MNQVLASALASAASSYYAQWVLLGILLLIGLAFGVGNVILSHTLGPARKGPVKDSTYESGVDPVGSTKERFNVRFYLVAMIFLVFDVEVLFIIPWLYVFNNQRHSWMKLPVGALFVSILVFTLILLVAYVYAWGKGIFQWD
ncbi:MAG: NADH-quinone oxidoreductase subunit A [Phycisphaerae bacterium]